MSEKTVKPVDPIDLKDALDQGVVSNAPSERFEFEGKSGRTWGDSGPFTEAVAKVCRVIRRNL